MAHSSHPQEMADAVAWLKQRLPQALPSEPELRAMGNADLKRLAASRFAASATCDARALLPSACAAVLLAYSSQGDLHRWIR